MTKITSNLPNNGYDLCECGKILVNGVCTDTNCTVKKVYDNGFKAKTQNEEYPIIEI